MKGFAKVRKLAAKQSVNNYENFDRKALALRVVAAERLYDKYVTNGNWFSKFRHGKKDAIQFLNHRVGTWGSYSNVLYEVCDNDEMDIIDAIGDDYSMMYTVKVFADCHEKEFYASSEMMKFINKWRDK